MIAPLIFSENTLHGLSSIYLDGEWFNNPKQIDEFPSLRVVTRAEGVFVFTTFCVASTRLLVIARQPAGLFAGIPADERRSAFDRCARIALRSFDPKVTLNPKWMPFHHGNRVSIFATSVGHDERVVAEIGALNSSNVYLFMYADHQTTQDLAACEPDYSLYETAVALFPSLVDLQTQASDRAVEGQIELEKIESRSITKGFSYDDWLRLLTRDQRRFLDHPLSGPIRLRGVAGTGKTLAMVLKALKTKYDADLEGRTKRILFVTHSWATAEYVDGLLHALDNKATSPSNIDVFPLLYLAKKRDYSKIGRQPLGIDSEEGKRLALAEVAAVLERFAKSDWLAYKSGCTQELSKQIDGDSTSRERRLFCWDLLIEFGCVIAAQGILTHPADREKYLKLKRSAWMMPLNAVEKQVIFHLWCKFMDALRQNKWISSDQIISDFLNDLSTFYWEAARLTEGYDVIFVDEMHLFNSQERLVFHNLLIDGDSAPEVIMALDPKQSPRETFTEISDDSEKQATSIYERARLPNPEKIDFKDVYRYTPEIGRLVQSVLDAVPALDFSEDWDLPTGAVSTASGETPRFQVVADKREMFRVAMSQASILTGEARKNSGRVAILCLDSDKFLEYTHAAKGQYSTDSLIIASRDDTERLRYAGRRFVVSMPEHVAGLQFDTVVLVDANDSQVPEGQHRSYQLRRFLSELYLGISRAERSILILANKAEGGLTKTLVPAVKQKLLAEVTNQEPPKRSKIS
jgi:hypothetical protein